MYNYWGTDMGVRRGGNRHFPPLEIGTKKNF